jgi:hypothetical protein
MHHSAHAAPTGGTAAWVAGGAKTPSRHASSVRRITRVMAAKVKVTGGGVLDLGNLCCFFVLAQKKWDAATLSHV